MNRDNVSQGKDAGLALALILLLIVYVGNVYCLILPAIGVLVVVMTIPAIFKPFAVIWFGFSKYLGTFSSKIILTLLFISIVTPISLIRRFFKADPLQLRCWKNQAQSAFQKSDHQYTGADMQHPY